MWIYITFAIYVLLSSVYHPLLPALCSKTLWLLSASPCFQHVFAWDCNKIVSSTVLNPFWGKGKAFLYETSNYKAPSLGFFYYPWSTNRSEASQLKYMKKHASWWYPCNHWGKRKTEFTLPLLPTLTQVPLLKFYFT